MNVVLVCMPLQIQYRFDICSLLQVDDEDALEAADEAAMALDDTLLNVYEVTRAAQQPRTRQRASLGTPQGGGEDSGAPSSKDLEVKMCFSALLFFIKTNI